MTNEEAHGYIEDLQRIFTQYRYIFSKEMAEANGKAIEALEKQIKDEKTENTVFVTVFADYFEETQRYQICAKLELRTDERGEKFYVGYGTDGAKLFSLSNRIWHVVKVKI